MPEKGIKTYSEYNYLKPGIASFLRVRHFEYALRLTKEYFQKCNVIDFGCGDGPFLPSLARYFNYVVGIDYEPEFIELASKVVSLSDLTNVELICNRDLTISDLKSKLGKRKYHILFLLETIEHVGDKSDLWNSKVKFIRELFTLIDKRGIIVISVPNMVGMPFLLQRLGLFLSNEEREVISTPNLLKASFLNYTSDLEQQWQGWRLGKIGHLGFNHQKLESYMRKEFRILKRKNILFQVMYACQRKD
jgi:2-polyprenyl-3-methyl-5-hydroxy-6-metoxy-1,4-benzoquinol methylase